MSIVALVSAVPASTIAAVTAAPTAAAATTTASSAATATSPAISAASPSASKASEDSSTSPPASSAASPVSSRESAEPSASDWSSPRATSVLEISAVSDAYCSWLISPRARASLASSATCFMISSFSLVCSICLVSKASFCARSSTFVGSSFSALSTSLRAEVVLLIELFASCNDLVSPEVLPSMSTVIPTILLAILPPVHD